MLYTLVYIYISISIYFTIELKYIYQMTKKPLGKLLKMNANVPV